MPVFFSISSSAASISKAALFDFLLNLAHLLFDQLGDFSLLGKSLTFNIFFREDQLAVIFYIEDAATAFDQFNF
jgi:hypothetical protein